MSKRVFDPVPGAPALTKAEKRDAAKAARARAVAAAKRRELAKNAAIALIVVGVIAAIFFWIKDSTNTPAASPSETPTAAPTATSTAGPYVPTIPAGANEALKTKPVVEKPSGPLTALKVTTLIEGTGTAAANGNKVKVNYVGVSFQDGTEFDSSWKRSAPYDVNLGSGAVIKGWDEGLVGVKVGSRVQIDIPSDKAYGDNGQPPGPLRFVIDVLAVS